MGCRRQHAAHPAKTRRSSKTCPARDPRETAAETTETAELVALCIKGDGEAQTRLYARYIGLVQRAASRKIARITGAQPLRADVDDICNEVFERILAGNCRALQQLKNPDSLDAWLMTIAQNKVLDYFRKWSSQRRVQDSCGRETPIRYSPNPADEAMAGEQKRELERALQELPGRDRLVLELFFIQGMKYTEIAELTRTNINTVSARIRRAKAKVRAKLEQEGDDYSR